MAAEQDVGSTYPPTLADTSKKSEDARVFSNNDNSSEADVNVNVPVRGSPHIEHQGVSTASQAGLKQQIGGDDDEDTITARPPSRGSAEIQNAESTNDTASLKTTKEEASSPVLGQYTQSLVPPLRFGKGRRGRWKPAHSQKLRNNLLAAVGFLELGNGLDFAANVWNTIPVPIYAAVLMGIGGSIAIILSFCAAWDAVLTIRNIRFLRAERSGLLASRNDQEKAQGPVDFLYMNVKLEVNRRELGQEIIDRYFMDLMMGFSSFIVGIGTVLAIAGANPRIYHASNLLSGYIGNGISALWAGSNALWCAYLYRRAGRHFQLGSEKLKPGVVKDRLRKRTKFVQFHAAVMVVSTILSAPAGMLTVTHWWAYFLLIPCVILAKWGNVMWKHYLGYSRDLVAESETEGIEMLKKELEWTIALQEFTRKKQAIKLDQVMVKFAPFDSITGFMARCGLFESLCLRLLNQSMLKLEHKNVAEVDKAMVNDVEKTESTFISTADSLLRLECKKALRYKERYLMELLGATLYDMTARGTKPTVVRASTSHRLSISLPTSPRPP